MRELSFRDVERKTRSKSLVLVKCFSRGLGLIHLFWCEFLWRRRKIGQVSIYCLIRSFQVSG